MEFMDFGGKEILAAVGLLATGSIEIVFSSQLEEIAKQFLLRIEQNSYSIQLEV